MVSDARVRESLSPLPDVGDIIFLFILQLLLFHSPNFVFADGSTGWHLVAGQHILSTKTIPQTDLISYTFSSKPWVAYEWLSDLAMATAEALGGLNGVAVFTSFLVALLFLILYRQCRAAGCHFAVAALLTVVGAIASSMHFLARPHIFSWFGVLAFLSLLERFRAGQLRGYVLAAVLSGLMLMWANLHPAFVLGFLLIVIYLICDLAVAVTISAGEPADAAGNRVRKLAVALLATFVASLVNPQGPALYRYIVGYLSSGAVLKATDEYSSPVFHGALQPSCFELLLLLLPVAVCLSRNRPSLPRLVTCLVFLAMALSAVRHIPLFVIGALPLLAGLFSGARLYATAADKVQTATWWRRLADWWIGLGDTFDRTESRCRLHLLPVLSVIILTAAASHGGAIFGAQLLSSSFDPASMPTTTLSCIEQQHLRADRGLAFDNWGGYIRYKTGMRVFIDDRADFYGERFYLDYGTVSTVSPGWSDLLSRNRIEWVLFPRASRLSARLAEEPTWRLACQDDAALLYVRQ